jgi:hypothetical protein
MKKIALISTFCDTQEKIDILEKNIITLKSHNIDVFVITPFGLPDNITSICDYYFLTKDNPVLEWPQKGIYMWFNLHYEDKMTRMASTRGDYGWAGLYQVKKLSEIALGLDYDYFYHMIYDLIIDDNVLNGLYSDKNCSVYPSKRDETVWAVGLHFMIFDRKNLTQFIQYITLENYLASRGGDAFVWLHNLKLNNVFDYQIEEKPVEDKIYYYQGHDFYNYSPIPNVKFFIEKDDEKDTSIKLFFYDVAFPLEISVKVGEEEKNYQVEMFSIIDLNFNKFNFQNVVISHNNISYDITEKIKKVKHNTLNDFSI